MVQSDIALTQPKLVPPTKKPNDARLLFTGPFQESALCFHRWAQDSAHFHLSPDPEILGAED